MRVAYRLVADGPIVPQYTNALRGRICQILEQPNFESLTLLMATDGGTTHDALSLYNFIRSLPVPIAIHNVGHIANVGIPVFLAGHRRTCAPMSRFVFSHYVVSIPPEQAASISLSDAHKLLDHDRKLHRQIVEQHARVPADLLNAAFGKTAYQNIVDAGEAREYGIVHDVVDLNPSGQPQSGVAIWTV